ncbi:MAG: BON domain-containing protein [Gammaproteobacteria bacterium]
MSFSIRLGVCAVAAASVLSGCVIVIGDDDDYDDDVVEHYDSSYTPSEYAYDAGNVLTDVRTRFNEDEFLRTEPILISARDGVVTLSGEVADPNAIERAVDLASNTPGVESVVLKVVLVLD